MLHPPLARFRFAVLLLLLSALGCSSSAQSEINPGKLADWSLVGATEIGKLGRSQQGTVVNLRGRVVNAAPLLGQQAFELEDATGRIWVMGEAAAPAPGSEVAVTGTLRFQSLLLNGQEQGSVYLERR